MYKLYLTKNIFKASSIILFLGGWKSKESKFGKDVLLHIDATYILQ